MHKTSLFKSFSLTVSFFILLVSFAHAGTVPQLINYQGTLTDTSGNPVPDGQYGVVFSIYDVLTGGTALWTETWNNTTVPVAAIKGNFNAMLGTHTPIPLSFFNEHSVTYLGIKVGNDSEMLPRQRISSVAYAFTAGSGGIPQGAIVMWSGAIDQIPEGWALCDGNNGTPDLRNRFVIGAGSTYAKGATGGSTTKNIGHTHTSGDHILTINEMPSHDHGGSTGTYPLVRLGNQASSGSSEPIASNGNTHSHPIPLQGGGAAHNHGNTGSGGSSTQDIMPPYYALAFIMKL